MIDAKKPFRLAVCFFVCLFVGLQTASAQQSTEGYIQSLRSLYENPDATSDTIGFLEPGDYVRLEHIESLIYRVYRDNETTASGYVVYPKLAATPPASSSTVRPVRSTAAAVSAGATVKDDAEGSVAEQNEDDRIFFGTSAAKHRPGDETPLRGSELRYVHNFTNVRTGPGSDHDVFVQLPPGAGLRVVDDGSTWLPVYKSAVTNFDVSSSLGFVHRRLLKTDPPSEEVKRAAVAAATDVTKDASASAPAVGVDTLADSSLTVQAVAAGATSNVVSDVAQPAGVVVYVTKTGKKYHLENCRHLRRSKVPIPLTEAKERRFEACRTCKPDKHAHEQQGESLPHN